MLASVERGCLGVKSQIADASTLVPPNPACFVYDVEIMPSEEDNDDDEDLLMRNVPCTSLL